MESIDMGQLRDLLLVVLVLAGIYAAYRLVAGELARRKADRAVTALESLLERILPGMDHPAVNPKVKEVVLEQQRILEGAIMDHVKQGRFTSAFYAAHDARIAVAVATNDYGEMRRVLNGE